MKQTIKNFLFKKRIKILRSKKGFSLLEVLIGVTIIGIISAIAVPRFQNYREIAAVTAADATLSNAVKAYNLCSATSGTCATLSDLKLSCGTCKTPQEDATNGYCVMLEQKISNKIFKACVQIKTDGTTVKAFGGEFKFCYGTSPHGPDGVTGNDDSDEYTKTSNGGGVLQKCDKLADCPATHGTGNQLWTRKSCKARSAGGVCASAVCT